MPETPPFWDDDPGSWDTAVLGGVTLPGLARIDGLDLGARWDIKEAPGTDGASETYQGYTPAPFNLVLRMWSRSQWLAFLPLAKRFRPKPGRASPEPVDVVHPELLVWGISRVIIRKIKPRKLAGEYEVAFDLFEYFPQPKKPVTKTVGGGIGATFTNALDGSAMSRPSAPSAARIKP